MTKEPIKLTMITYAHLGQPLHLFHPGQEITGTVKVEAESEMNVLGVRAQFIGYAGVLVSQGLMTVSVALGYKPSESQRKYSRYLGRETYVELEEMLLGDFINPTKISAGVTELPFKFRLPASDLPCSYDGSSGKVESLVEALVKNVPGGPGLEYILASQKIDMASPFPLSRSPNWSDPVMEAGLEMINCCCFKCGLLKVAVRTDKGGYDVEGDVIELEVKVDNQSRRRVRDVIAELCGVVTFNTEGKDNIDFELPQDMKQRWGQGIPPRSSGVWITQLTLPPNHPDLKPTHLVGGCSLIDLEWNVRVVAEVNEDNQCKISCPIILGTSETRMKDYPNIKQ